RWTDTVKDLDIVATASDPGALTRAAAELDLIETASTPGANAVRLRTHNGIEVDLRVVEEDQFGNVLQHLTGSKQHNVAVREHAVKRGLHVSEYGILDDNTDITHRCATEQEVYELLGLPYFEPELREGSELSVPDTRLVSVEDLRGDLHSHTSASDGKASVTEMAEAARGFGYEYLAVTDHSPGSAGGVPADRLRFHIAEIRATEVDGIKLLAGSEVNILPNGGLDYPDELLAQLDWVVASVHTSFRMSAVDMTKRIIAAVEHPHVHCIGHLSGRKLGTRAGYELDFDAILEACLANGTLLEINANPLRRDINEGRARAAAQAGLPLAINTDSHRVGGFGVARFGVATARRAGLGPEAIANARPWSEFRSLLKRP
ncbi:MAG: DNA polymerase/3'-5' exonuclease PolX, partial [Solirubrobacterales bacterium]|nr:DNA polymerase/3'-5' exonuclease PolX [Solirubrobacterales bacterium]